MKFVYIPLLALLSSVSAFTFSWQAQSLPADQALSLAKASSTGNNRFAADLMNHYIKDGKQQNIFFSPFSISSALSMTSEGAKDNTKKEMMDVLHLAAPDSLRQYGFLGLNQLLNNPKAQYKLNTSNSLWVGLDIKLTPDFLQCARDYYQASVESINFKNAEQASKTINLFVENKTEKKIKNLINPSLITPLTKLILINTIYFKSDWKRAFKVENTQEKPFATASGSAVQAKMMNQTAHFNYLENNEIQALEMPYAGNETSMVVILPKNGTSVPAIDAEKLEGILNGSFKSEEVIVNFPKFRFETSYKMKEDLSSLGMQVAFSNDADFSGISKLNSLKIAEVIHKAFVEVEEKGTEAAAATAVIMELTSSVHVQDDPNIFNANHPFLFIIRHNASGAILFMGMVNNPTI